MAVLELGQGSLVDVIQPTEGSTSNGLSVIVFNGYRQEDVGYSNPEGLTPQQVVAPLAQRYADAGSTVYVPQGLNLHFPRRGLHIPTDQDVLRDVDQAEIIVEDILTETGTGHYAQIWAGFSGGSNISARLAKRVESNHPGTINSLNAVSSVLLFEPEPDPDVHAESVVSSRDNALRRIQGLYDVTLPFVPLPKFSRNGKLGLFFESDAEARFGFNDVRRNRNYNFSVVDGGDHMQTPGNGNIGREVFKFVDLAQQARQKFPKTPAA